MTEIGVRLNKIDRILHEVSQTTPNWTEIEQFLEDFPNAEEIETSLLQDGEMLKEQPHRWMRERKATHSLISFLKKVFDFHIHESPEFASKFNHHLMTVEVHG